MIHLSDYIYTWLSETVFEKALTRSEERMKLLSISDTLIEHAIAILYLNDKANTRHWKYEVLAFMTPRIKTKLKSEKYKTRKKLIEDILIDGVLANYDSDVMVAYIQSTAKRHSSMSIAKLENIDDVDWISIRERFIEFFNVLVEAYASQDLERFKNYVKSM
jgi:hypothetical protein